MFGLQRRSHRAQHIRVLHTVSRVGHWLCLTATIPSDFQALHTPNTRATHTHTHGPHMHTHTRARARACIASSSSRSRSNTYTHAHTHTYTHTHKYTNTRAHTHTHIHNTHTHTAQFNSADASWIMWPLSEPVRICAFRVRWQLLSSPKAPSRHRLGRELLGFWSFLINNC
jgi:hypothetical protein